MNNVLIYKHFNQSLERKMVVQERPKVEHLKLCKRLSGFDGMNKRYFLSKLNSE